MWPHTQSQAGASDALPLDAVMTDWKLMDMEIDVQNWGDGRGMAEDAELCNLCSSSPDAGCFAAGRKDFQLQPQSKSEHCPNSNLDIPTQPKSG